MTTRLSAEREGVARAVHAHEGGGIGPCLGCEMLAEIDALRAEQRDLREKVALHEARQVIFEEGDRDLRAAVLAVAGRMRACSTPIDAWARALREACGEKT